MPAATTGSEAGPSPLRFLRQGRSLCRSSSLPRTFMRCHEPARRSQAARAPTAPHPRESPKSRFGEAPGAEEVTFPHSVGKLSSGPAGDLVREFDAVGLRKRLLQSIDPFSIGRYTARHRKETANNHECSRNGDSGTCPAKKPAPCSLCSMSWRWRAPTRAPRDCGAANEAQEPRTKSAKSSGACTGNQGLPCSRVSGAGHHGGFKCVPRSSSPEDLPLFAVPVPLTIEGESV